MVLQLYKTIENIKEKGIATLIGTIDSKEVVVKLQNFANALHEYNIQQELLKYSEIDGFINFLCFAKCSGDKDYIESFAFFNDFSRLCKSKGHNMGIIIMNLAYNKAPNQDSINRLIESIKHLSK